MKKSIDAAMGFIFMAAGAIFVLDIFAWIWSLGPSYLHPRIMATCIVSATIVMIYAKISK